MPPMAASSLAACSSGGRRKSLFPLKEKKKDLSPPFFRGPLLSADCSDFPFFFFFSACAKGGVGPTPAPRGARLSQQAPHVFLFHLGANRRDSDPTSPSKVGAGIGRRHMISPFPPPGFLFPCAITGGSEGKLVVLLFLFFSPPFPAGSPFPDAVNSLLSPFSSLDHYARPMPAKIWTFFPSLPFFLSGEPFRRGCCASLLSRRLWFFHAYAWFRIRDRTGTLPFFFFFFFLPCTVGILFIS